MTRSRARTLSTVGGALLASLLLAACSGSEPVAEDQPVEASSSTPPSSSPTSATPTPTPTARPLSRFEDEPTVVVARKWAAAVARSSTESDRSLKRIRPFVTPTGLKKMQGYFEVDMGLQFPGPVPFTPVGVREQVGRAEVPMCMWTAGFAFDPKTDQPRDPRRIDAGKFVMVKQAGTWRIDDMIYDDHSCEKTAVKGRAF